MRCIKAVSHLTTTNHYEFKDRRGCKFIPNMNAVYTLFRNLGLVISNQIKEIVELRASRSKSSCLNSTQELSLILKVQTAAMAGGRSKLYNQQ